MYFLKLTFFYENVNKKYINKENIHHYPHFVQCLPLSLRFLQNFHPNLRCSPFSAHSNSQNHYIDYCYCYSIRFLSSNCSSCCYQLRALPQCSLRCSTACSIEGICRCRTLCCFCYECY